MDEKEFDDEFTPNDAHTASKLKTKKQRKGNAAAAEQNDPPKPSDPIILGFDNSMLVSNGFPVVPSGDRVIIEEIDNSFLTMGGKLLIVDQGGKDNSSRVARIVAISPDLFNKDRHPHMFYRVGDLVYFNHLSGNYMRLRVPGKSDLGRYWCLWITDILSKFIDGDAYFAEAEKMIQEHHLTGPLQRPEREDDIDTSALPDFQEGESHGKNDDGIKLPDGIQIN